MGYKNNPRYTVYVDKIASHGDTTSVKTACDQLSALTRSTTVYGRVIVNPTGQYAESAFTIPSYVQVWGNGISKDSYPSAWITRASPAAGETAFITINTQGAIRNCLINASGLPANFTTNYALVRTTDLINVQDCRMFLTGYSGANPAYAIYSSASVNEFLIIDNCYISTGGTGVISVYSSTDMIMRETTIGGGNPTFLQIAGSAGRDVSIENCRFIDTAGTNSYFINSNASQNIRLINTRVPYPKRTGSTLVYEEYHPTPRQLSIALVKNSVNKAANYVIDENADGTVEATAAITVFMPATIANVDVGQAFCILNNSAGAVTVDGNGVNINGAATYPLPAQYDKVIIQKNASSTWSVIGS